MYRCVYIYTYSCKYIYLYVTHSYTCIIMHMRMCVHVLISATQLYMGVFMSLFVFSRFALASSRVFVRLLPSRCDISKQTRSFFESVRFSVFVTSSAPIERPGCDSEAPIREDALSFQTHQASALYFDALERSSRRSLTSSLRSSMTRVDALQRSSTLFKTRF